MNNSFNMKYDFDILLNKNNKVNKVYSETNRSIDLFGALIKKQFHSDSKLYNNPQLFHLSIPIIDDPYDICDKISHKRLNSEANHTKYLKSFDITNKSTDNITNDYVTSISAKRYITLTTRNEFHLIINGNNINTYSDHDIINYSLLALKGIESQLFNINHPIFSSICMKGYTQLTTSMILLRFQYCLVIRLILNTFLSICHLMNDSFLNCLYFIISDILDVLDTNINSIIISFQSNKMLLCSLIKETDIHIHILVLIIEVISPNDLLFHISTLPLDISINQITDLSVYRYIYHHSDVLNKYLESDIWNNYITTSLNKFDILDKLVRKIKHIQDHTNVYSTNHHTIQLNVVILLLRRLSSNWLISVSEKLLTYRSNCSSNSLDSQLDINISNLSLISLWNQLNGNKSNTILKIKYIHQWLNSTIDRLIDYKSVYLITNCDIPIEELLYFPCNDKEINQLHRVYLIISNKLDEVKQYNKQLINNYINPIEIRRAIIKDKAIDSPSKMPIKRLSDISRDKPNKLTTNYSDINKQSLDVQANKTKINVNDNIHSNILSIQYDKQLYEDARQSIIDKYNQLMTDVTNRRNTMLWYNNRRSSMSLSRSEIKLLYADDMTTWNNLLRNKSKDDEISNNSNELNSTSSLLNPTDGIFSHQTFEIANDDSNPSDNFEREVITNSSNNVPSVPEPISNKPDISGNLLSSFSGVRSLQAPGGTSTFSLSNDTSDNLMNYQSYSGVRHIQAPGGDSTIDLSNGSRSNITEVSYSGKRHLQAPGGDSTINLSDSHIVDSKNSNSVIQIAHSTEGMSSIDLSSDNHLIGIDSSQLQKSSFSGIRILQAPGGDSTLDLSKDFILSDNNTTSNFSGVRSLQDPGGTSSLTLSDESTDFINNNTVITFSGVKSLQAPGGTSTLSLSNDTSDDNMNYQSYSGVRQIQAPGGHSTIDLSNKWNTNINNVSYSGVRHLQAPGGNSTINLSSSLSNIDSKEAGGDCNDLFNESSKSDIITSISESDIKYIQPPGGNSTIDLTNSSLTDNAKLSDPIINIPSNGKVAHEITNVKKENQVKSSNKSREYLHNLAKQLSRNNYYTNKWIYSNNILDIIDPNHNQSITALDNEYSESTVELTLQDLINRLCACNNIDLSDGSIDNKLKYRCNYEDLTARLLLPILEVQTKLADQAIVQIVLEKDKLLYHINCIDRSFLLSDNNNLLFDLINHVFDSYVHKLDHNIKTNGLFDYMDMNSYIIKYNKHSSFTHYDRYNYISVENNIEKLFEINELYSIAIQYICPNFTLLYNNIKILDIIQLSTYRTIELIHLNYLCKLMYKVIKVSNKQLINNKLYNEIYVMYYEVNNICNKIYSYICNRIQLSQSVFKSVLSTSVLSNGLEGLYHCYYDYAVDLSVCIFADYNDYIDCNIDLNEIRIENITIIQVINTILRYCRKFLYNLYLTTRPSSNDYLDNIREYYSNINKYKCILIKQLYCELQLSYCEYYEMFYEYLIN